MKKILVLILLSLPSLSVAAEDSRYGWAGASVGIDLTGDYAAATLSAGWFPVSRELDWGVIGYWHFNLLIVSFPPLSTRFSWRQSRRNSPNWSRPERPTP